MSESIIEETTGSATEAAEGFKDGSRIAGEDTFTPDLDAYSASLRAAIVATETADNAVSIAAERRAGIACHVILPSGFPDWGGWSDAYSQIKQRENETYSALAVGDATKTRTEQNIRQAMRRNGFKLLAMVGYILTNEAEAYGLADEADAWNDDDGRALVIDNPSDALQNRVEEHRLSTKRGGRDPISFKPLGGFYNVEAEDGDGGGGPGAGAPANVARTLEAAVAGSDQIAESLQALQTLRLVTKMAQRLVPLAKSGGITDRPLVTDYVRRSALILTTLGKTLDGKTSPAEVEALDVLYFNPVEDVPKPSNEA